MEEFNAKGQRNLFIAKITNVIQIRGYKLNCVTARFKYEEPAAPQTQS